MSNRGLWILYLSLNLDEIVSDLEGINREICNNFGDGNYSKHNNKVVKLDCRRG